MVTEEVHAPPSNIGTLQAAEKVNFSLLHLMYNGSVLNIAQGEDGNN